MSTPLDLYRRNIDDYSAQLQKLQHQSALISFFRLAAFAGFGWFTYLTVIHFSLAYIALAFLILILFVLLVKKSASLTVLRQLNRELIFINKNECAIIEGGHNKFPDGSTVTVRAIHADDLDIFGPGSLYHLINRTTTSHGRKELESKLNSPWLHIDRILEQQQAISLFARQTSVSQMIIAHGLMAKEEGRMEDLQSWLNTDNVIYGNRLLKIFSFLLPVISMVAFYYYLDTNIVGPLAVAVLVNWIVIGRYFRHVHRQHLLIGKKQVLLEQYASILRYFNTLDAGNSTTLHGLQARSREAYGEIRALSKLTTQLDQRLNMFVNLVANSFFLYEIHCMRGLEKWKSRNRTHFQGWLNAVAQIEALNSLAVFAFNHPAYSYPVPAEGAPFIRAEKMAHPLIRNAVQVANDITTGRDEKLLLVTGSNMSGKSTFLRTIGVNLLIAQTGAPVCAKYFEFVPMTILSSIRINDSLQENTSYFMAELKRLHLIIEKLGAQPSLVLIDEILRGTNSDDKTHGSEAFIKKLIGYNCITLFATHDLSLSTMETQYPQQIANYCFESVIREGELVFDYKLHKGVATNRNASFLMQKMGII